MANSFTFNGTDFADYGLVVNRWDPALSFTRDASQIQLPTKAIAGVANYPPKNISLAITISATTIAAMLSYIDDIKGLLNIEGGYSLILDNQSARYWTARFKSIEGRMISPLTFQGQLTFVADDPAAYSTSNTSSDFNIDSDPKTVTETPGGNMIIFPVYTLTAGEDLTGVTIKIQNVGRNEELQWTGSLANGEELEIDCDAWTVKKEGTEDMATVTGEFPWLDGGSANSIKITALASTGTLNIAYRDKYV